MRDPSRMLALVGLASLVLTPLRSATAAPVDEQLGGDAKAAPDTATPDTETPTTTPDTTTPDTDVGPNEADLPLDVDTDEDVEVEVDEELDTDETPAPSVEPGLDTDDDEFDDEFDEFDDDYQPLRDSPEARTARRWLGAGIGATTVGAVLVGGSIALAMTDPCDPLAGNNCFTDARNRAAVTMGAPGGVLLLGGVAMTIVGALQKRRLFFDYAGGVTASRDHIGVVVVGRF